MFKLPNTLSFRLTLWYASTFIIILLAALMILYLMVNTTLNARIDEGLIEDVEEFRTLHDMGGVTELHREINNESLTDDISQEFVRLLDTEGNELFASDLSHWGGMHTIQTTLQKTIASHPDPILETIQFRDQDDKTRIVYGLVTPDIIVQLGESTEEKNELMELLALVFIPLFFIVIPIATFAGWKVARHTTKGITDVSHAVAKLKKGDFNYRVSMHSQSDEIQTLADTFNSMSERIRNLITEMREMMDNIAHDLRSPLGRIRAISESALSGTESIDEYKTAAVDTLTECDRLINMINTTLDIAEAEAGVSRKAKEDVNIGHLIEEVCELYVPAASEKNIKLTFNAKLERYIKGNKQILQRMLANLLDNSLKYTPSNGEINIALTNSPDALRISISDTGIGIATEEHDRVFDRFYRCDDSRTTSGCGLGLSFARAVARSHDGDISVTSTPGKGSAFTIKFPTPH